MPLLPVIVESPPQSPTILRLRSNGFASFGIWNAVLGELRSCTSAPVNAFAIWICWLYAPHVEPAYWFVTRTFAVSVSATAGVGGDRTATRPPATVAAAARKAVFLMAFPSVCR